MGFLEADNITLLQKTVKAHYPNIFKRIDTTKAKELSCAKLKSKSEKLDKNFDKLATKVSDATIKYTVESAQLSLMMLISTNQYLLLVLIQPCHSCNNSNLTDKIFDITSIGFQVKSTVEYTRCNTISKYTNKTQESWFTKAISVAELIGGIPHNALQSLLAILKITNQTSTLKKCIEHTLLQSKKSLVVEFDCSWYYVQNQTKPPVITFYVVEKTRFVKKKLGLTKTICKSNFDKTAKHIKHAILIEVLNKITSLLENAELHLEICIDGDLDSNKTLMNVPIVNKQDSNALSEDQTQYMQIEGLIKHLQNNHSDCWPDVYWAKDDPKIILQELTFCNSPNSRIANFQKLFETIFKLL
ncbi:23602_t:CDS:2 [Gigaspora margarita]|uniref:23602_t:CDS:1 n=1 Tax=Gigaspora margarita TaxID=4874 RepID=A0ABN7UED3_GIGMA|nr:23602_t:CDS:2 [Gigaspora margarita]